MIRVVKGTNFGLNRLQADRVKSRTALEKSNLSLKGEFKRHKRQVKLPKLKFLEKKDEKPTRA
jgi:hypothetical protein